MSLRAALTLAVFMFGLSNVSAARYEDPTLARPDASKTKCLKLAAYGGGYLEFYFRSDYPCFKGYRCNPTFYASSLIRVHKSNGNAIRWSAPHEIQSYDIVVKSGWGGDDHRGTLQFNATGRLVGFLLDGVAQPSYVEITPVHASGRARTLPVYDDGRVRVHDYPSER